MAPIDLFVHMPVARPTHPLALMKRVGPAILACLGALRDEVADRGPFGPIATQVRRLRAPQRMVRK